MLRIASYYTELDRALSHFTDEPPEQHWDPQKVVFVRTKPCCAKPYTMKKGKRKVPCRLPTTQLLPTSHTLYNHNWWANINIIQRQPHIKCEGKLFSRREHNGTVRCCQGRNPMAVWNGKDLIRKHSLTSYQLKMQFPGRGLNL